MKVTEKQIAEHAKKVAKFWGLRLIRLSMRPGSRSAGPTSSP